MHYLGTPLTFKRLDSAPVLERDLPEWNAMLDHLVELIIFTPKGSFLADPDFGFEYWNHEYTNIHYRNFNSGQALMAINRLRHEVTKTECQESIRNSLSTYAPALTDVNINVELNTASEEGQKNGKARSKHLVKIIVEGAVQSDLGTTRPYKKEVVFLMEPTLRTHR